jgi:hypothetical protein
MPRRWRQLLPFAFCLFHSRKMNTRAKKILLLVLATSLLAVGGRVQNSMNRDRRELGLTVNTPLQGAPPMLAFTTVALGGFRGLISNYLWIRANNLQLDDKFFEAAQLADWITDLEPHFAQVWSFQAWNMAYNISVKFKENGPGDFSDRWRWVSRGIELVRDRGLRYNPESPLLYQQLAWIYQHKMGQNLDDGNLYYKQQWAEAMTPFFGPNGTNFDALINPRDPQEITNALVLRETYKIDPVFAEKLNEVYGPLDWRLPEAHAIYWYALGLKMATNNPGAVPPTDFDLMQLRRGIFQTEQQAFRHGHMIVNPFTHSVQLAPDLELIPKANDSYLQMYAEEKDEGQREDILRAHRNFLRDVVYFLYENARLAEAARWFKYLGEKYPNFALIDKQPDSFARNLTLDEYAFARVQEDIGDTSQERTTSAVLGMLVNAYADLAIGQDDRAAGFRLLAQKVHDHYQAQMGNDQPRAALWTMDEFKREALRLVLDPQKGLPYEARTVIRNQLGMPPETNAPPDAITNAAPAAVNSTNSAASSTNLPAAPVLP